MSQTPNTPQDPPKQDPPKQDPPASKQDPDAVKRYAVYDLRYLKFVGSVSSKRPSKADAKALAGHDDVEVREV